MQFYLKRDGLLNYHEAERFCSDLNAVLPMPSSDQENDWLLRTFNITGSNAYVWLGANNFENNRQFKWADGRRIDYNYKQGERWRIRLADCRTLLRKR